MGISIGTTTRKAYLSRRARGLSGYYLSIQVLPGDSQYVNWKKECEQYNEIIVSYKKQAKELCIENGAEPQNF